ncbi:MULTISPECIES: hypothetical protein [unclassified Paenibacillus]|uniref:prenylated flavin chaperone LpdD n=1 Tax=unclassified Paenibacillus TaxID=185978 RepID=UPI001F2CD74B|nr:hypothetical protein [Paenibacillus sp. JJ-223]CAH1190937.1 hypothetical protein PAECIP111890_00226 [Paenibacillus sp. JJ-223]
MNEFDLKTMKLQAIQTGDDRVLLVTGGKAHIGAVATYYPDGERINGSVMHIPGHKEQELCERLARKAAQHLRTTVTVIMGIHYNGITRMQIDEIVQTAERLLDEHLNPSEHTNGLVNDAVHS